MTCPRWAERVLPWAARRVSLSRSSPPPGLSRTILMCGPLIKEETHRVRGAWSPLEGVLVGVHSDLGAGPGGRAGRLAAPPAVRSVLPATA